WDFSVLLNSDNLKTLLSGFWLTIVLTFWSLLAGTALGLLVGILASLGTERGRLFDESTRSSRNISLWYRRIVPIVRRSTVIYIDVIRAIPLLLLILVCYYGLPIIARSEVVTHGAELFGRRTPLGITAFESSVVALSVNLSAFLADLVR